MGESYLPVAVFNDEEHGRILPLHDSVQGFNTHAVLGRAERQRPWIAYGSGWEMLCQLWGKNKMYSI